MPNLIRHPVEKCYISQHHILDFCVYLNNETVIHLLKQQDKNFSKFGSKKELQIEMWKLDVSV